MRRAVEAADRERAAWPLAGRALVSGEPVVIDRIRPGELEGIVNPAMDAYLGALRDERDGVRADARRAGHDGRDRHGPRARAARRTRREEIEAAQRIADGAAGRGRARRAC